MEPKKPYLSKTLWLNFITGGLALFYPPAQAWVTQNPAVIVGALTGLNFLLRLVTKDKIGLGE